MNILGVFAEGPNPAACLVAEGKLVAFVEEERLVREKSAARHYPALAIRFCLDRAGLSLSKIDSIAFGWDATKYEPKAAGQSHMSYFYDSLGAKFMKDPITLGSEKKILARFQPGQIRSNLRNAIIKIGENPEKIPEIRFVGHHYAHAASAYYCSGFDSAAILTIDGSGEEICAALWKGHGTEIRQVERICLPDSLGWFYAAFTEYLGFLPYRDEGKLMALAAYGRPNEKFSAIVDQVCKVSHDDHGYQIDPYYTFYGGHRWGGRFTDLMVEALGEPGNCGERINQNNADLAFAVQQKLEFIIQRLIRKWLPSTGLRRLCLAGGVALNCKMNGSLEACRTEGLFDELFIQPISNDAGTALGAAQVEAKRCGYVPNFKMEHVYWGPDYSDRQIAQTLRRHHLEVTQPTCISESVAHLLLQGAVVAWFQDRSEAGPRALGNRSVLANPLLNETATAVNRKLKHRESWRPFGPSVLRDSASALFSFSCDAPFMIRSFLVNEAFRTKIPAVVHCDGSSRPQTVVRTINPKFHALISAFERLAGAPAVLNTSFNGPNEPMVCSPEDAVGTFMKSNLDALAIGNYLVSGPSYHRASLLSS